MRNEQLLTVPEVREEDAGVASALVNTTQQVGGSLGTALLNTLAASGLAGYVASHHSHSAVIERAAATHGFSVAFVLSVVLLAVGAVGVGLLVRAGTDDLPVDATPAVV
jgi:hypothetical protein